MQLKIDSNTSRRFCYIDRNEKYLTLDTKNPECAEGLIYRNQTLFTDFGIFERKEGFFLLNTRYENTETILEEHSFTCIFKDSGQKIRSGLFSNALYFDLRELDTAVNDFVIICSIDIAKKLDKKQGIAASQAFQVIQPDTAELLQLTKAYGKKAGNARIIRFTTPGELYISLEHSPSGATKKARELLKTDGFSRHKKFMEKLLSASTVTTDNEKYNEALAWGKFSAMQFINGSRNLGIWAGLPWFRDYWGRDTFISMPGALLLSGDYDDAEKIFLNFINYQDTNPRSRTYGRLPNIYRSSADIIYNTADATLHFIREVLEYAKFTGDMAFLEKMWDSVNLALECDRTLRTDSSGFLLHGDADTWMDSRIFGEKSYCPRGNRANDIQVLWYTALLSGSRIAELLGKLSEAEIWKQEAQKLKTAFTAKFYSDGKMADCILKDDYPDTRVRPNQLMLITVPEITGEDFIEEDIMQNITEESVKSLLFPYGICSLSQNDIYFHPYHDTSDMYHKDAAYHNGTIWTWNAGFTAGALCRTGHQDLAWTFTKNIASQLMDMDVAGSLSENLSAYPNKDGSLHFSGAYSTCRGNAEFVRTFWQHFIGLDIDLLKNRITLKPHFPSEWKNGNASIKLKDFTLLLEWKKRDKKLWEVSVSIEGSKKGDKEITVTCIFNEGQENSILNGNERAVFTGSIKTSEKALDFARPASTDRLWKKPNSLEQKNYLSEIALKREFNKGHPDSLTAIRN